MGPSSKAAAPSCWVRSPVARSSQPGRSGWWHRGRPLAGTPSSRTAACSAVTTGGAAAIALVCGLDGVIRHFDVVAQSAVEARHGLPEGAIAAACFSSPLLREAISGRVSDATWRAASAQSLTPLVGVLAVEALRESSDVPVTLAADVLDLVGRVRARHPVVLLTNATDRLDQDLARLGLVEAFDVVVNTSTVGEPKPGRAAFAAAFAAVGTVLGRTPSPGRMAFVDDTPSNVLAAQGLGWRGHQFRDASGLHRFLADCGLLDRA